MNYYIITGTSRGLGLALVKHLVLSELNHVFGISRNMSDSLVDLSNRFYNYTHIQFDLLEIIDHQAFIDDVLKQIPLVTNDTITLINNAGILKPIKQFSGVYNIDIHNNIMVNLTAPMIMSSQFIENLAEFSGQKRIVNISSGAAKKPYEGWTAYCSAKSGLDMMTKCIGLEQSKRMSPVKCVSIAPGIIDTDMQSEIRISNIIDFPMIEQFKAFKDKNLLSQPDQIARSIIKFLNDNNFNNGDIIDIRDYSS